MKPNRVDEFIRLFNQMSAAEIAQAFTRIRNEGRDLPSGVVVQSQPPSPRSHETMAGDGPEA